MRDNDAGVARTNPTDNMREKRIVRSDSRPVSLDRDSDSNELFEELSRYKAVVELTARVHSKSSSSTAVHELIAGVHSLLNVGRVIVYLSSETCKGGGVVLSPLLFGGHRKGAMGSVMFVDSDSSDSELDDKIVSDDPAVSVAGYAAHTNTTVTLNNIVPGGADERVSAEDPLAKCRNAVMVPITNCASSMEISGKSAQNSNVIGLLECVNKAQGDFTESDVELLELVAGSTGSVLHQFMILDMSLTAQRRASALLDLANASRHIREDNHIHLPSLVERLMMTVYKIMRADRVSLYLCDNAKRELWCCISKDYRGSRIPFGVGIIGNVAISGQALNIHDCYQDKRFNRIGDRVTGYHTRSMLAVPVTSSAGNLVAVLAVINKLALIGSDEFVLPPLDVEHQVRGSESASVKPYDHLKSTFQVKVGAGLSVAQTPLQTIPSVAQTRGVAGITPFTTEDEVVIESISTEIGNLLERNALDAHYENILSEVLSVPRRDHSKVLTASLLAATTNCRTFKTKAAFSYSPPSSSFSSSPSSVGAGKATAKQQSSPSLSHLASGATTSAALPVVLRVGRGKARLFQRISELAWLFRAVGIFKRVLRRTRGFRFEVTGLEQQGQHQRQQHDELSPTGNADALSKKNVADDSQSATSGGSRPQSRRLSRRGSLSDNRKQFRLSRRTCSADYTYGSVDTAVLPGANFVFDFDSASPLLALPKGLLARSKQWCLDVFELSPATGPHLVLETLKDLGLYDHFRMQESTVLNFACAIRDSYLPQDKCAYHNWDHALGVSQMCVALLVQTGASRVLTSVDQLALILAALGHDAGHEGRNNDFEIKVGSELAVRYNDKSVLEQHHAALMFQILRQSGNNVLECAARPDQQEFRKVAIEAILATDMSRHMDFVKKVMHRVDTFDVEAELKKNLLSAYSRDNQADRLEFVSFALHSIDIGGQLYPPELSDVWSSRLIDEFTQQAIDERAIGLEPASYMVGLEQPHRQAQLQHSFTSNIVLPAWQVLEKILPETQPLLENLQVNIAKYKRKIDDYEANLQTQPPSAPSA